MPIEAGEAVLAHDLAPSRSPAGGTIAAGTAVMIDANGEMVAADTEAGDLAGVAKHTDDNGGRGNSLGARGAYVVAAAAGVTDGDRVNAGNATGGSTGQVIADSAGPALALSDTGGTWQGRSVPAGHAVVLF